MGRIYGFVGFGSSLHGQLLNVLIIGRGERMAGGIEKPDHVGKNFFIAAGRQFVRHGKNLPFLRSSLL